MLHPRWIFSSNPSDCTHVTSLTGTVLTIITHSSEGVAAICVNSSTVFAGLAITPTPPKSDGTGPGEPLGAL